MLKNTEELEIKKLLLSLEKIKGIYGKERFHSGDCANLVLAIGQCLADIGEPFNIVIIDSFVSEDEDAEESEFYKDMKLPECFSHCYINVCGEDVDVSGVEAFENWIEWMDLPSKQNKWGEYELLSEIPIEGDNPESVLSSFGIIAEQSCVSVDYNFVEELSVIIKKELS